MLKIIGERLDCSCDMAKSEDLDGKSRILIAKKCVCTIKDEEGIEFKEVIAVKEMSVLI